MQRRWQQLQAQTAYPWGRLRPYGRIEGDTLVLSPDFYQLDREQKRAVFQLLPGVEALGWYQLMTPAEQAQAEQKFSGTMTTLGMLPFDVVDSDGRLVFYALSGCDYEMTLTEYERAHSEFQGESRVRERYVTKPKYPLAAAQQKRVSQTFWAAVGHRQQSLIWIAWVPELGYFELDTRGTQYGPGLQKFWRVAPKGYRYVVVDEGGRVLAERRVK